MAKVARSDEKWGHFPQASFWEEEVGKLHKLLKEFAVLGPMKDGVSLYRVYPAAIETLNQGSLCMYW